MVVVGQQEIFNFIKKYADGRGAIQSWLAEVKKALWKSPQDIKDRYATASFLADNVVIFNIKGNSYRLETKIAYKKQKVLVKWLGTHKEYDERNKKR